MSTLANEKKRPSAKGPIVAERDYLIRLMRDLNLFAVDPFWSSTLTNVEQISNTRVFLLLMFVSMLMVVIYSSSLLIKHDVTVDQFSIDEFERLEQLYPYSINGFCREVSIPQHRFLHLSPELHEIYSSEFVDGRWIASLFTTNATSHNILDFRTFAFAQFRSLALLCHISSQAIRSAHQSFNKTQFVHRYILSRTQFEEIGSVLFDNMQRNIRAKEKRTGNVISMMTAHNYLWTAVRGNFYMRSIPGSKYYRTFNRVYQTDDPTSNSMCDCDFESDQFDTTAGAF